VRAEFGVRPEEARFAAGHVLFVEGSSDGIDVTALRILLEDTVRVEGLGPASGIESAAMALRAYHPTYYFLIDRDHRSREDVDQTWLGFPDPDASNRLIWRRRELENYFIIPEYLARSQYINCTSRRLHAAIRSVAEQRVYLDAANIVIIRAREELKRSWISPLKPADGCADYRTALNRLLQKPEFSKQVNNAASLLSPVPIQDSLRVTIRELLGDKDEPQWGEGNWLEQISGKEVLNVVVDRCFRVEDAGGKPLQGKKKLMEVVKDLLRLPLKDQPDDFQELHRLIMRQVGLPGNTVA